MAFSEDRRLWCTVFGQGDIAVLNGDGRVFVVEDEHGTLFSLDVGVARLKLYD